MTAHANLAHAYFSQTKKKAQVKDRVYPLNSNPLEPTLSPEPYVRHKYIDDVRTESGTPHVILNTNKPYFNKEASYLLISFSLCTQIVHLLSLHSSDKVMKKIGKLYCSTIVLI